MTNPFSKLLNNFRKKSYWTSLQTLLFRDAPPGAYSRDYLDSYSSLHLVYTCIRKIAEKVATTEFKLYKVGKNIDEVTSHPLLDLLSQVNPYTTKFEMLDLTQTFLELLGNAYWLKVRGKNSRKPLELWMLRPDWVKIVPGTDKLIQAYEYQEAGGTKTIFPAEDVIHFKQPNPKSTLYGMSTVEPAIDSIRSLIYAIRWNMNFFYNSARPDFLITTKAKLDDSEKEEFKRGWASEFSGLKSAHKFGILTGEIDIKELTRSMRDMEFSKLHEISTDDILSAFGVPRAIVGMKGMNRAEAEAQIYTFLSETVEPKIRRIVERLNEFLVPEYGENLYLDFEDPTPEDRTAQANLYASALQNNWMLINEVRDLEGLPPLEGGWDFYLPMTAMPAGGLKEEKMIKIKGIEPEEFYKFKKQKEQEVLKKKVLAGKRKLKLTMELKGELLKYYKQKRDRIKKKLQFTEEQKNALWFEHNTLLSADEKMFATVVRKLFKKQAQRIREAVRTELFGKTGKSKSLIDDIVDWNIEKRIFAEISLPIFTDVVMRRGERASKLVGLDAFTLTEPVKRYIDKKTFTFADEVNDTTKDKLREALKAGVDAGESINEIDKRVQEVFQDREGYETERIARTEMIDAHNQADLLAYEESGVVEKKEWLGTRDGRMCEECEALDGEVVDLRDNFSGGDDAPPVHPESYDKKTEIYTENGWKNVSEIKVGEKCLSLNPVTFDLEFVPVVETYKHKENEMIKFSNRDFDMVVTKNHNVFYQTDWNSKHNKDRWKFVKAKDLIGKSCGKMFRSSKWRGKEIKEIELGSKKVSPELYAEFMGWYLSEGSAVKTRKVISISQSKKIHLDKWERIRQVLDEIGFHYWAGTGAFWIKDKKLFDQLKVFGEANKKYVPKIIKDAKPEIIKIFLDSYCLGDGYVKKGKNWKGYQFKDSKSYSTSSKRMADDLGELILKIGKRPSYSLQKTKGISAKFRNGNYIINNDCWVVHECCSQYSRLDNMKVEKIEYNDFAYCVDLEKYHLLYTRRNGKCVWSGNCRCSILPHL